MNNATISPDGKFHRHPDGGYYCGCITTLDGAPAVIVFRTVKGQNGGGRDPYWATTATVRPYPDAGAGELPALGREGSPIIKNGFTKKQATDVYRVVRGGFVTDGTVARRVV